MAESVTMTEKLGWLYFVVDAAVRVDNLAVRTNGTNERIQTTSSA